MRELLRAETLKLLFVYGNITFVVVAGFYVLYQLATRPDLPTTSGELGLAAIFGGFVGTALQFLTGSEIATRANRNAASNFASGLAILPPSTSTTIRTEDPASETVVETGK